MSRDISLKEIVFLQNEYVKDANNMYFECFKKAYGLSDAIAKRCMNRGSSLNKIKEISKLNIYF